MKKEYLVTVLFVFIALAGMVFGQVSGGQKPNLFTTVQTRPQAIPTTLTTVVAQDAYVCYADFTATGQNILVEDNQVAPVVWLNNALGTGGSPSTWVFVANDDSRCRWMPNGIKIQAGSSGVTGYLTFKCPASPCVLNWGQ